MGFAVGDVLDNLVQGVLRAQKDMDRAVQNQTEFHLLGEDSELVASRIWYHFERVSLDLEVETLHVAVGEGLCCRVADPQFANLVQHSTRTHARISLTLAPATRTVFSRGQE